MGTYVEFSNIFKMANASLFSNRHQYNFTTNAYQTNHTPSLTPPTHPPPPMNLMGPILYKFSPWVTRQFPGWFKWGFKEYWKVRFSQMTKVCWDSQTLAFARSLRVVRIKIINIGLNGLTWVCFSMAKILPGEAMVEAVVNVVVAVVGIMLIKDANY